MLLTGDRMRFCTETYVQARKLKRKDDINKLEFVHDAYSFNHIQGYFMRKDGIDYAAFAGSNEVADWFHNFMFRFSETPYKREGTNKAIKVHKGFYYSYLLIRDLLHAFAKTHSAQIIITGHSFGAALATLCALDLKYNFPEKEIALFTTGSPRVGNEAFVHSFNKWISESVRCVNRNDIVPGVPFKCIGFTHVGKPLQLQERNIALSIKDHDIERYFQSLTNHELDLLDILKRKKK